MRVAVIMPKAKPLTPFAKPIVEFHYKDDSLHDPLILEDDVVEAGLLTAGELAAVKDMVLVTDTPNDALRRAEDLGLRARVVGRVKEEGPVAVDGVVFH